MWHFVAQSFVGESELTPGVDNASSQESCKCLERRASCCQVCQIMFAFSIIADPLLVPGHALAPARVSIVSRNLLKSIPPCPSVLWCWSCARFCPNSSACTCVPLHAEVCVLKRCWRDDAGLGASAGPQPGSVSWEGSVEGWCFWCRLPASVQNGNDRKNCTVFSDGLKILCSWKLSLWTIMHISKD